MFDLNAKYKFDVHIFLGIRLGAKKVGLKKVNTSLRRRVAMYTEGGTFQGSLFSEDSKSPEG